MQAFNNNNYKIYNKDGSDRNRKEIIYQTTQKTCVFNCIVHLISYYEDNVIGNYVPYPREYKETTEFINEIRNISKELEPSIEIKKKLIIYSKILKIIMY